MRTISENRKARFDYDIIETLEGGIELLGHEVKSVKSGKASITGAYAVIRGHEAWLLGANIPPYQPNNTPKEYDPARSRKLLLKSSEIDYLIGKLQAERLTLIPLKLYNKHGLIKVELGLGQSRKKSDKREIIRKREAKREISRNLKT